MSPSQYCKKDARSCYLSVNCLFVLDAGKILFVLSYFGRAGASGIL
jgi:hypothetical protein